MTTTQTITPQRRQMRADQVANSAGGWSWRVDPWDRLVRFLVLGTEGGTYYATERELTGESLSNVTACLRQDGRRVVDITAEISQQGRAPKNDPALFVLAVAAAHASAEVRAYALSRLPEVARIGTHLLHFASFVKRTRGWGRGLRRALGQWYTHRPAAQLAYQMIKYQQRDGFSHRDVLRLAHPIPPSAAHEALFAWATQGTPPPEEVGELELIRVADRLKDASPEECAELIRTHRLPREVVPTNLLNRAEIWEALAPQMGMTAMIRSLGKITRIYQPYMAESERSSSRQNVAFDRGPSQLVSLRDALERAGIRTSDTHESPAAKEPEEAAAGLINNQESMMDHLVTSITDAERLRRARVHPLQVLSALTTYSSGKGRGKLRWEPKRSIVEALERAFKLSFGAVTPTGKRWLLALDVSASMGCGRVSGIPGLTPHMASAAMALVTLATEEQCRVMAFCHRFVPLKLGRGMSLAEVLRRTKDLSFGGTNCALPMIWALEQRVKTDVFVIYTDSETWFGAVHPAEALQRYRAEMGIDAKLIVVAMVGNDFTIADPDDPGMLDVVGMDTSTPEAMAAFVRSDSILDR